MKKLVYDLEFNNEKYALLMEAYFDDSNNNNIPRYEATAIKENDKVDEHGYQTVYDVIWSIKEDYYDPETEVEVFNEVEDETILCDWDSPSEVTESSSMYNKEHDWYQ